MSTTDDYGSPWKDILETYLEDFFAFFFPQIHAEIDWTRREPIFLDKELQKVVRDAELGRRLIDKLVQVWRRDGSEAWVLIHIEVQDQEEADFNQCMFVYSYRLFDRYRRPVVSLAILGDERVTWRPDTFTMELWGCSTRFRFPVIKLLDYQARWAELEQSRNSFATVVMTHLTAQATRRDPAQRAQAKLTLMRRLYELGYDRTDIIKLFHFIDWLLRLPDEQEEQFWQAFQAYEEAQQMPYISSVERIGIQKGLEQGLEQGLIKGLLIGIELVLELKFGAAGLELLPEICALADSQVIEAIYNTLRTASTVDEVRQVYASLPNNTSDAAPPDV